MHFKCHQVFPSTTWKEMLLLQSECGSWDSLSFMFECFLLLLCTGLFTWYPSIFCVAPFCLPSVFVPLIVAVPCRVFRWNEGLGMITVIKLLQFKTQAKDAFSRPTYICIRTQTHKWIIVIKNLVWKNRVNSRFLWVCPSSRQMQYNKYSLWLNIWPI